MSQRQYEILFIAEQNLGEPEVDTLTATVKGFIEKENGTVEKVEKWGKKRLAYTIGKNREGSYVLMIANAPGSSISRSRAPHARDRRNPALPGHPHRRRDEEGRSQEDDPRKEGVDAARERS